MSNIQTIFGALLHDCGKIVFRSGKDGRAHSVSGGELLKKLNFEKSIQDCALYHHADRLKGAKLPVDSPAYIVYLADNYAAGADRRKNEEGGEGFGFDRGRAQSSIFNLLNNNDGKNTIKPQHIDELPRYEDENYKTCAEDYCRLLDELKSALIGIEAKPEYCDSLLEILESALSYVPASTAKDEVSDISLFDHLKLTAAFAVCMEDYATENGITDYRETFYKKAGDFGRNQAFLLASIDFSGIQKFIYGVPSKGAMKSLRSRSFYLEAALENVIDQLLEKCGLTRVNLLYSGGGHAYFLAPNTNKVKNALENGVKRCNASLRELFGIRLFLGLGMEPCSADVLTAKDAKSYSELFRRVSAQLSLSKLRRYTPDELFEMNADCRADGERECGCCGSTDAELADTGDGTLLCKMCSAFMKISKPLLEKQCVLLVAAKESGDSIQLPSTDAAKRYLRVCSESEAKKLLEEDSSIERVYSKNKPRTGLRLATKLWMGDTAAVSDDGSLKAFDELAKGNIDGIERVAVLRADVDNLGSAFTSGFVRDNATTDEGRGRYVTLSRSAVFSRQMSLFFKYHINNVLKNGVFTLNGHGCGNDITIVYSGGDDLFIVGSWDSVLCAAIDIYRAFREFSGSALTLSAGIGLFEPHFPVCAMAQSTQWLEDCAKSNDGGAKDSVSLFGIKSPYSENPHTYRWQTFIDSVLGEKLNVIESTLSVCTELGNSFLYNIDSRLKGSEEKLNLARLAYILARFEYPAKAASEKRAAYSEFAKKAYEWALDGDDNRQLQTAIMIYVYLNRTK